MRFLLVNLLLIGLIFKSPAQKKSCIEKEELIPKIKAMKNYIQIWGFVKYHQLNSKKDFDIPFFGAIHFLNQKEALLPREYNLLINQFLGRYAEGNLLNGTSSLEGDLESTDLGYLDIRNEDLLKNWNEKFKDDLNITNRYVKINHKGDIHFTNEKVYSEKSPLILEYRILSIARYYNIIKYFHPSKIASRDWDDELEKCLLEAYECHTLPAYHLMMLEYTSKLKDSNGSIGLGYTGSCYLDEYLGKWQPSVEFLSRGDSVFIVHSYKNKEIAAYVNKPIMEINNLKTNHLVDSLKSYINASNPLVANRDLTYLIKRGSKNSRLRIKYDDGVEFELKRIEKIRGNTNRYLSKNLKNYIRINDESWLVDISMINSKDKMEKLLSKNPAIKNLVIDLTENSKHEVSEDFWDIFEIKKEASVTKIRRDIKNPGNNKWVYHKTNFVQSNGKDKFKGNIYLLISEYTQNQNENLCMQLKMTKKSKIIGRPSAGGEGTIAKINLVGGFVTSISSSYTFWGEESFQNDGIAPEVLLSMLHIKEKEEVMKNYFKNLKRFNIDSGVSGSKTK